MKVLREEITPRYHVELDEAETTLLKHIRFLPPHAEPRARMWVTSAERVELEELLRSTRAVMERAAATAAPSRVCVKCFATFRRGPTAMDLERFDKGICGGCDDGE